MLFTIVTVICVTVYFLLMFTGGKSWRDIREVFYGNYYAEDALINETDAPNTPQAVQNCIDNNIGIKTEVYLTKDRRAVISTYNDLSKEYGIDKKISESTLEELEAAGILTLTQLIEMVGDKVPLILELKVSDDNEALCQMVGDSIKASELKNIAVCSFHPGIVTWFRDNAKNVFRGIVSAPAKEFKSLSKLNRWMAGNLGNNGACRPNFTLYRNRPHSIFVKWALMSGVLNGVWTIETAEEGKKKEAEGKEMIVVRGFMPETVHFKDLPKVEKTPQQLEAERKAAEKQARYEAQKAERQRSIAEILADDDEEFGEEDSFDEFKEEVAEFVNEVKEEAAEIAVEIKEELEEIREKIISEE